MPEIIDQFTGQYHFLSNFAISPIMVRLGDWSEKAATVEHAFQALKTEDRDRQLMILTADTPRSAKQMGRRAQLRPNWDAERIHVMHTLLVAKFTDPTYRQLLLNTGAAHLIEGNTWGDDFWGMTPRSDSDTGYDMGDLSGLNWLGTLLMLVRSELA